MRAELPPDRAAALGRELEGLEILEEVLRWGLALSEGGEILEVVIQDEYSHDVVMAWESGYHLAFDTT